MQSPASARRRSRKLIGETEKSFISPEDSIQDDEAERRRRRSNVNMQKTVEAANSVSAAEVKTHLELCQKLYMENKITIKNVWHLQIIDIMSEVIKTKLFNKDPLTLAATSLEICTKVFGLRVDDVHTDVMKLANSLSTQKQMEKDRTTEDANETQVEGHKKTKKKKKAKLILGEEKKTVNKNVGSLEGPVPQLPNVYFSVDVEGDCEHMSNLFSNMVPFDHRYHDHLLDGENPCFFSCAQVDNVNKTVIGKFLPQVRKFDLCRDFSDFEVDKFDPDESIIENLHHSPKANGELANLIYDNDGVPIVELDGSVHDIFEEVPDVMSEEEIENGCHQANHQVHIRSFCPDQEVLKQSTVVSSFISEHEMSKWMKTIWIGPTHWKNKILRPTAPRYSGKIEQKASNTKKVHIVDAPIDFHITQVKVDFNKKAKSYKKIVHHDSKFLLPRRYVNPGSCSQNLLLVNYIPDKLYQATYDEESEEFEHGPYNHNNLNDSQYCPQNEVNNAEDLDHDPVGGNHSDGGDAGDDNMGEALEQQNDSLNTSVDAVFDNSISKMPYATRAKKVNMKRIKSVMWDVIQKESEKVPKMFSDVYSSMNKQLPQSIGKEMSVPIAFFALLHLTNDNNLDLQMVDDLSDVVIERENNSKAKKVS